MAKSLIDSAAVSAASGSKSIVNGFRLFRCLIVFGIILGNGSVSAEDSQGRVSYQLDQDAGKLIVSVDQKTAFVYQFGDDVDLPHFDPFNSSSGRPMTVKIAEPYPHHRSFWVADERVSLEGQPRSANFYSSLYSGKKSTEASQWPIAPYSNRVQHVSFSNFKSDSDELQFDEQLDWVSQGTPYVDERRHYRVRALDSGEYFLDFQFELRASYGALTIQRDPFHYAIPYIRMNEIFNVDSGEGKIVNSEGGVNQEGTDNRLAHWVDYSAPVEQGGDSEGLACFVHPSQSPPVLWLTRNYGTWGPRGGKGYHSCKFTIAKGDRYQHRVGLLIHHGDVQAGRVAERYRAYADGEL